MRSNVAKVAGKQRFFPLYQVAIFLCLGLLACWVLYPGPAISRYFSDHFEIQPVTVRYINNLLQDYTGIGTTVPINESKFSEAEYQQIYTTMFTILKKPPLTTQDWKMHWIAYQIFRWDVFAQEPGQSFRQKGENQLIAIIPDFLNDPIVGVHYQALAADSLALNKQKLAFEFYQKGLAKNPNAPALVFAKAAEIAQSADLYEESAQYYFSASKKSELLSLKRSYFKAGIQSLMTGSLHEKAMSAANAQIQSGPLASDPETLIFLSKTALASNRPDLAETYISRAISLERRKSKR